MRVIRLYANEVLSRLLSPQVILPEMSAKELVEDKGVLRPAINDSTETASPFLYTTETLETKGTSVITTVS